MKKSHLIIALIAFVLLAATVYAICIAPMAVSFYSDDGTLLKIDKPRRFSAAEPPNNPQMTYGNIFQSWDKDLRSVKRSMKVHPICENVLEKTNAFALSGAYANQGESLYMPLQLCGKVCLIGFDLTIRYDPEALKLESVLNEDGDVLFNTETPGEIRCNFAGVKNLEADMDIGTLQFTPLSGAGEYPVSVEVNSAYVLDDPDDSDSDAMSAAEYEVIGASAYILD